MNEIDELVDWISNPPINRGMVPYVLVLNLEEFTRTKEGIEFLKAFADRLDEYFSGRGCRLYRLSLASLVMTVADQEVLVSGILSDTKLQLLRMIGRQLPDYFGAVDVNRITQIIDLRRDRPRALDLVRRLAAQAANVDQVFSGLPGDGLIQEIGEAVATSALVSGALAAGRVLRAGSVSPDQFRSAFGDMAVGAVTATVLDALLGGFA